MNDSYFAYGSNLYQPQMEERCPGVEPIGPATAPHHCLLFTGASRNWRGAGVAELRPHPEAPCPVPGFLYRLTAEHLEDLDRFEGSYHRELIQVLKPHGETTAWTYLRNDPAEIAAPLPEYVARMAHAYGRNGHDISVLIDALKDV